MNSPVDETIKIPVERVLREFECPVCMNLIEDSYITPCGHVFCKPCLAEWINRSHECPSCKVALQHNQMFKNFHFDSLYKLLIEEKEKASKQYYDQVMQGAVQRLDDDFNRSPIENVFQLNMREALVNFENYYNELKRKHDTLKQSVKGNASKLADIELKFGKSVDLIVEAYDRHMKSMSPAPELLPVRVMIKVPSRNYVVDLTIPVTHNCTDIRGMLEALYISNGNPIVEFEIGALFQVRGPMAEDGIGVSEIGALNQVIEVSDETIPLGRLGLSQGSSIVYTGALILKNDAPKECFTFNFVKNTGMRVNYYTCASCKLNWICEPCADQCHANHSTRMTRSDHQPDWNCCYCVKHGICKLPNFKSK
mmetsp:Transcript_14206/g.26803  ORF Transcript_14206/g.26803 Transcript_14206/m.26803 type:complete len:367 (+) Transcript_14206:1-1101(+)